ncbi:hypothetical protein ACHAWF_002325 [Thalassiosira exigua]
MAAHYFLASYGQTRRRIMPSLPLLLLLAFVLPASAKIGGGGPLASLPRIDLSNLLGTRTSVPACERILSQPVFQVTTAWGSPYMLFEKYTDEEKALEAEDQDGDGDKQDDASKFARVQQKEDMQDTRPVSLYFLDEHDARALADEMKQMKHMRDGDLRVTCASLGKAVRQASRLGNGLPTGQPVDDVSGKLPNMDEGGSLRHRIVPSKRELFYAARCKGRERVGCFGADAREDAELLLQPPDAIEGTKMSSRRKAQKNALNRMKRARQLEKEGLAETDDERLKREYAHMEGQVGLPVFCAEGLAKKPPALRRMVQGAKKAWSTSSLVPLYFSYEDLASDWAEMRSRSPNRGKIPEKPPQVEVFNLLDIVTSIDRDQWKAQRRTELVREGKGWAGKIPVLHRLVGGKRSVAAARSGLERVVFVPSSLAVDAKERIRAGGNGKARLRPMRAWGKNA